MRFGKANGLGLVALELLSLILQVVLIFVPRTNRIASPSNPPVIAERKVSFLPSVLGGVCILFGAALIFTSKTYPEEEQEPRS
jgi:Na+(H+)/acetate symporter ActP